jgi:hypothetical protein
MDSMAIDSGRREGLRLPNCQGHLQVGEGKHSQEVRIDLLVFIEI